MVVETGSSIKEIKNPLGYAIIMGVIFGAIVRGLSRRSKLFLLIGFFCDFGTQLASCDFGTQPGYLVISVLVISIDLRFRIQLTG